MHSNVNEELIGFCSAPWTDCLTYADGELKACDRNVVSLGNWQKLGLKKTWEGEKFQEFRSAIREGRYPNQDCASCHNNGTQRTAYSSLIGAYSVHCTYLYKFFNVDSLPKISELHDLLSIKKRTTVSDLLIAQFYEALERLKIEGGDAYNADPEFHNAIVKLKVIAETLEDYLNGVLLPRRVATFRQSQLQAKCTARCVMCVGKFTGEIVNGPTMEAKYIDEAFAEMEDVTDFWCNGAEYLFFKEWKKTASMLHKQGVKLRISTNGILLTESNIDFMLEGKMLGFLTLSLDGATKQTMESIRVRVNYDKNLERTRYLLKKATEQKHYFEFTAAFVMMKRNFHELPQFLRMLKELMPENCIPQVSVLCQPLENFALEDYRRFVHQEHHSLLGETELRRIFLELYKVHKETGIRVAFYNIDLDRFMELGMPFPKFFPRQMDIDMFLNDIKSRIPFWNDTELDFQNLIDDAGFDSEKISLRFQDFVFQKLKSNAVFNQTILEFPEFEAELKKQLPEYAAYFVATPMSKYDKESFELKKDGIVFRLRSYYRRPFSKGDEVYSIVSESIGRIEKVRQGMALLNDGQIVPIKRGSLFFLENLSCNGTEIPLHYPEASVVSIIAGKSYLLLNQCKNQVFGNKPSPLLWRASVIYRSCLSFFGIRAIPVGTSINN